MSNKIVSIRERIPQDATLPDGFYEGVWGGHTIEVDYNEKIYELETDGGVKGMGFKVVVHIENGEATFHEIKNR